MTRMIQELVFHTVLLAFMAVLFWESRSFPEMNIGGQLGSAWWPQLTLGLGMVLTVASAVFVVRKGIRETGKAASVELKEIKSLGISGGIFCAFLLVMPVVGFMGAVPVLIFGFMYQLGARKPLMLILVPILSSPLFAFIFGRFMEVSLPRGIGWVRILSFYVY